MKHRGLLILAATLLAFIALAPITGCTPKKDGDLIKHCDNLVKDEDETGIDCGGSCNPCVLPCDTTVCQNGGTCNGGNCNCAAGYTGNRCQSEIRSAFTGNYRVAGTGVEMPDTNPDDNYTNMPVRVTAPGGNIKSLYIEVNGGSANLTVQLQNNYSSFTIPPQVQGTRTIEGTGSFTTNNGVITITLNFVETQIANPSETYTLSLTGPKL